MAIAATYTAILDLARATSGIAFAPEELPISLSEADLPCCLLRVGEAEWNEHAVGLHRQVWHYYLDCFVAPIGEGVVPDEGYKKCLTPMHNLGHTFLSYPTLSGAVDMIGGGRGAPAFRDGGVIGLEYAGRKHFGFTLDLLVTEKGT